MVCNDRDEAFTDRIEEPIIEEELMKPEDGLLNELDPGPILREEEPIGLLLSILLGEPGGAPGGEPGGPAGGGRPLIRALFLSVLFSSGEAYATFR